MSYGDSGFRVVRREDKMARLFQRCAVDPIPHILARNDHGKFDRRVALRRLVAVTQHQLGAAKLGEEEGKREKRGKEKYLVSRESIHEEGFFTL